MNSSSTNLQLILLAIIISLATQINSSPNPYCQTSCGNVTIPFPFGTTSECCLDASFLITCNYSSYNPPKPFLNLSSSFEVLDISVDGQLRVVPSVPIHCYDTSLSRVNASISKFYSSEFLISSTRNKFNAIGHDTYKGSHLQKSRIKGSMLFYVTFGFIFPAIGSSWIFWRRKQKKLIQLRTDLFGRNGGFILRKMLERRGRLSIYTAEELKKATNNYDENNIMNRDPHSVGIEYKGELLVEGVSQLVTIKRCNEIDRRQIKAFISKLVTLSLVHHINVVKLIGCCLETQVPLLVYEFITDKTLYDYIHEDRSAAFLSWDILLKIATETAGALAYMHSADDGPIIHGNLNSSNISIHSRLTAKVQGFAFEGCCYSSDVPFYMGTLEYLDPDYLSSGKLTEKSDVYSFGVVLAEILTGKNVLEKVGGKHLAQYFVSSSTRDQCIRILDHRLVTDSNFEQLKHVAKLAERCLSVSSTERPTMKEVAKELESAIGAISSSTALRPNSRLQQTVYSFLRRNKSL